MDDRLKGFTKHGDKRARERTYTEHDVATALETATAAGRVVTKTGKYGTLQTPYFGANGFTAIIETEGRNAGKLITGYWRDE